MAAALAKTVLGLFLLLAVVLGLGASADAAKTRNGLLAWSTDDGGTEQSGPCETGCEDDPVGGLEIPERVDIATPGSHRVKRLPCSSSPAGACGDNRLAFSPDGRLLAISGNQGLVIRRASGRLVARVAVPGGASFSWAPSGRAIAIVASLRSVSSPEATGLYIVGRDGTGLRQIATLPTVADAVWSPTGRHLALWIRGPERSFAEALNKIEILRSDGSGRKEIRRGIGVSDVKWPQPGLISWTRFGLRRRSDDEIYVSDPAGGGSRRLARNGSQAVWSPHGRYAVYSCRAGIALCAISAARPRPRMLTRRCDSDESTYTWSPDGRYIACGTSEKNIASISFRTGRARKLISVAYAGDISWQALR